MLIECLFQLLDIEVLSVGSVGLSLLGWIRSAGFMIADVTSVVNSYF